MGRGVPPGGQLRRGDGPREVLATAAVYVGAVIGAGFGSGQEVLRFFTAFGHRSGHGVVAAGLLLAIYGAAVVHLGARCQARSHRDLLERLGGWWLGRTADTALNAALLAGCAVMLAGAGALVRDLLAVPAWVGRFGMGVLSLWVVLSGLRGVAEAAAGLVPLMVGGILALCALAARGGPLAPGGAAGPLAPGGAAGRPPHPELAVSSHWLGAAALYAAYNLLLACTVLAPLGGWARRPVRAATGAALGGICLGACTWMVNAALLSGLDAVAASEVPLLALARAAWAPAGYLYAVVLAAAIYTSAVAGLWGLAARVCPGPGPGFARAAVTATVLAFLISGLGFGPLIATLYPALGYLGLFLLVAVPLRYARGGRP